MWLTVKEELFTVSKESFFNSIEGPRGVGVVGVTEEINERWVSDLRSSVRRNVGK